MSDTDERRLIKEILERVVTLNEELFARLARLEAELPCCRQCRADKPKDSDDDE